MWAKNMSIAENFISRILGFKTEATERLTKD